MWEKMRGGEDGGGGSEKYSGSHTSQTWELITVLITVQDEGGPGGVLLGAQGG